MINVAGQKFIQYEQEIDELIHLFRGFENYIGDDKIRNDVLNKVNGKITKENKILKKMKCTKIVLPTDFFKLLNKIKREMQ